MFGSFIRILALALAFFPPLAFAQSSPIPGFPPGVFSNKASLDPASGGGGSTTIFSQTLTTNDSGNNGLSFRTCFTITAGSSGHVKATFQAGSGGSWVVAHASIGVSVNSTLTAGCQQTTTTPVELTFSGVSGFTLTASSTLTSDSVPLSFTSSNVLVIVTDITSGDEELATGSAATTAFLSTSGSTYNQANPAGYSGSGSGGFVPGFNLVQTQ